MVNRSYLSKTFLDQTTKKLPDPGEFPSFKIQTITGNPKIFLRFPNLGHVCAMENGDDWDLTLAESLPETIIKMPKIKDLRRLVFQL